MRRGMWHRQAAEIAPRGFGHVARRRHRPRRAVAVSELDVRGIARCPLVCLPPETVYIGALLLTALTAAPLLKFLPRLFNSAGWSDIFLNPAHQLFRKEHAPALEWT